MAERNKNVVIYGVGDQARIAQVYYGQDSEYQIEAFTVQEAYLTDTTLGGLSVVPFEDVEEIYPPGEFAMFVAVGFAQVNKIRSRIYDAAKEKGYELVSFLSSRIIQWGECQIGDNAFIVDDTVIHPFVTIGNDVCISGRSIVGHDSVIGDHCFIGPNAVIAGRVTIGRHCFIGANSTIRNGVTVAPECVIGAGAIIFEDTHEQGVYLAPGTAAASIASDLLTPFFGATRR